VSPGESPGSGENAARVFDSKIYVEKLFHRIFGNIRPLEIARFEKIGEHAFCQIRMGIDQAKGNVFLNELPD